MVANQGGNTGQQSPEAVMIRQLAKDRFDAKKPGLRCFGKARSVWPRGWSWPCFCFAAPGGLPIKNEKVGIVMGGAILCDMLPFGIAGGSIPLVFRALGRDPAQASKHFPDHFDRMERAFFIFLWPRNPCFSSEKIHFPPILQAGWTRFLMTLSKKTKLFPAIACLLRNIIGGAGILLAIFRLQQQATRRLTLYGNVDIRQAGPWFWLAAA